MKNNNIEVTEVKIFKIERRGALLGYANIVLNNSFIIRGIRLLERENRRFVSMPSRKLNGENKGFRDLCHPINSKTREEITKLIFDEFDKQTEEKK